MQTERPGNETHRVWLRWQILIALAAVITVAVIRDSLHNGRLADVPDYDDINYISHGAEWFVQWKEQGIRDTISTYLHHPPKSLYCEALAAASFAAMGIHEWAPYAASVVAVLAMLLLGDWAFRGVAGWRRLGGVALIASVPMVTKAAGEFRPDMMAAAMLGFGLLLILTDRVTGSTRRMALAGAAIGASLLAKPTVFVATGITTGAALALSSAAEWATTRPRPSWKSLALAWGTVIGIAVLVAAVYPPAGWLENWKYFYENIVGNQSKYWVLPMSRAAGALWYLTGAGGRFMLGNSLWVVLGLWTIGLCAAAQRRDRRELARFAAIVCLLLLLFAMATLNKVKSSFLGLPFQTLLAGSAIWSIAAMLRAGGVQRRIGTAALVCGLCAGSLLFRLPPEWWQRAKSTRAERRMLVSGVREAVRALDLRQGSFVTMTSIGAINTDAMRFFSLQDGKDVTFGVRQYVKNIQDFQYDVERADAVIATEPGISQTFVMRGYGDAEPFPYVALQGEMIKAVKDRPEFNLAATVPVPGQSDKSVLIFRRGDGFRGWEPISGFYGPEGPYAQWKLPVVRWAFGDSSVLRVKSEGRPLRLTASARSATPDQRVTVRTGGRDVAQFAVGPEWTRLETTLNLPAGEHDVELTYTGHLEEDRKLSVLYLTLIVSPAPPEH